MSYAGRLALPLALALGLALPAARAQTPPRPPRPPASPSATAPELVTYLVRRGDTCASIARRLFRDARRTDLVHAYNDLGPAPHRLTEGQALRVPRRAPPQRGPLPDAVLSAAHNRVEVYTPEAHPAHANDPLFRGSRVSTLARSTAEVTFTDETQLRLSEQTLVVILGDTSSRARRMATAQDTTLVNGTLRAYLGALVGRAPARPIATQSGRVLLGPGEAQVQVETSAAHRPVTTLAVYHGRSRLQVRRRTITVPEGFAVRAEAGVAPAAPRPLPVAPEWVALPAAVVFTDETADVAGEYRAGHDAGHGAGHDPATPPSPAQWHVQLASDERFGELVTDARVPVTVTHLEARGLPPGHYAARVSAIDADRFEGPFSALAPVVVVRARLVPTATAHRALVELPGALYCGLDGAPLAPTGTAPVIDRLRPHGLRCAAGADGASAAETTLPPERRGPFTVIARLTDADPRARTGRVRVRLIDHAGEPVVLALGDAAAVTTAGATAGPVESPEAGVWAVPVTWPPAARTVALRLTVDGTETADTPEIALPEPPPDVLPPPRATLLHRVALRGEAGAGTLLSDYQRNADPTQYEGNVRGFSYGLQGTLRLGLTVAEPVALQLSVATWVFPSGVDGVADGRATMYTLGVRVEPVVGRLGRAFLDGNAGVALTGELTRFGFDVGAGFEFALGRAIGLGPMVRYNQIVQPGSDAFPYDARFWSAGLSLGLRLPP